MAQANGAARVADASGRLHRFHNLVADGVGVAPRIRQVHDYRSGPRRPNIGSMAARRIALTLGLALVLLTPVSGAEAAGGRTVGFAGSSWAVKASTGVVGPGPNVFSDSPDNVWVDAAGQLHMRITNRDGQWRSAEVILDRSLGYGTYRWTLASPVGRLDPNVVLGLFTWSDDAAYNHREIDIEVARWGNPTSADNAQYVVQPWDRSGNLVRFVQPDVSPTTHEFTWTQKSVSFRSATATGQTISAYTYRGPDVPKAGNERTRMNLWLNGGSAPTDGAEVEVVLSGFTFTRR